LVLKEVVVMVKPVCCLKIAMVLICVITFICIAQTKLYPF
jgi:hypothetical protein